jgi:hypothetical protein
MLILKPPTTRQAARCAIGIDTSISGAKRSNGLADKNVGSAKTVSVNVVWAISSKQRDELIYNVTVAPWNAATRKLLD